MPRLPLACGHQLVFLSIKNCFNYPGPGVSPLPDPVPINDSCPTVGGGSSGAGLGPGGFSNLSSIKSVRTVPVVVGGAQSVPVGDQRHCLQSSAVPMGVLSCMKYLMFIFNVLVFAGGTCLVGVGVWVAVDPAGFQDIVAAKPVLSVGAYLLLAVGIALSLLGFLGCCGALRRSRLLLLVFFILVSLVFVTQLVGAALFLVHWKQIRPELFLSELRRNYCGDEGAEVFSVAWNTLMVTFSCCGVLGPEDFGNGSRFQELHPGTPWPRACCARNGLLQTGELLGWEQCQERSPGYIHEQGCFPTFGRTLQKYISVPGTCSLAVLGIEIFAMFFAFCLYYNFD
ncbi:tetraspanin-18-like isoform X2 [Numida meleagris]|uniref:tetraspanin-18-like isoform X2 n=1 Tax=Numida meleagris TaxID=8996 RepID=UPI000B3DCEEA|nr:tetraspanin-18-like isoform X2 [Numida meleagris]